MKHPSLVVWEKNLKNMLDELDELLEDKFGTQYRLHPARSERGLTSNKSHDGLFSISAGYSLGIGSELGKGYVIDVRMVTLENIPPEIESEIDNIVLCSLKENLPKHFPGKNLQINKDGNIIKMHGDLNLGVV